MEFDPPEDDRTGRQSGEGEKNQRSNGEEEHEDEEGGEDEAEEDEEADDFDEDEEEEQEEEARNVAHFLAPAVPIIAVPAVMVPPPTLIPPQAVVAHQPPPLQQMAVAAMGAGGGAQSDASAAVAAASARRFTYNMKHYSTYDACLELRFRNTQYPRAGEEKGAKQAAGEQAVPADLQSLPLMMTDTPGIGDAPSPSSSSSPISLLSEVQVTLGLHHRKRRHREPPTPSSSVSYSTAKPGGDEKTAAMEEETEASKEEDERTRIGKEQDQQDHDAEEEEEESRQRKRRRTVESTRVGMDPEDNPAEDDCEAEPSQPIEDDIFAAQTPSLPKDEEESGNQENEVSSSSRSMSGNVASVPALRSPIACIEEGISRNEVLAHARSLDHLFSPLAELQRNAREMENFLHDAKFHYIDLAESVERITHQVADLDRLIHDRKKFLSFMLSYASSQDVNHPVQLNLGYFGVLPLELVLYIFSFLDAKDLLQGARVCSTFAELFNDTPLWKNIAERTWDAESIAMQKPAHKSYKWLFECKMRVFKPNEVKNGKGSFVGEHGDLYQGEWKDNKRQGVGMALMQDGRRYDGEWEADVRSGFGIFRWPYNYAKNGGDLYAGTWFQDQRHGEGIYIWSDGTVYEGQWKEGKRDGCGRVVWPDGRKYEGDYKDGKMSGKGTFCWPDGSIYQGEYKDGKRHGEGTYTYSTMMGGMYTGQWRNGMRDGWGKLVKGDGEVYQGVWKFNCPFGGVLKKKDGTVIEKFWRLHPHGS